MKRYMRRMRTIPPTEARTAITTVVVVPRPEEGAAARLLPVEVVGEAEVVVEERCFEDVVVAGLGDEETGARAEVEGATTTGLLEDAAGLATTEEGAAATGLFDVVGIVQGARMKGEWGSSKE